MKIKIIRKNKLFIKCIFIILIIKSMSNCIPILSSDITNITFLSNSTINYYSLNLGLNLSLINPLANATTIDTLNQIISVQYIYNVFTKNILLVVLLLLIILILVILFFCFLRPKGFFRNDTEFEVKANLLKRIRKDKENKALSSYSSPEYYIQEIEKRDINNCTTRKISYYTFVVFTILLYLLLFIKLITPLDATKNIEKFQCSLNNLIDNILNGKIMNNWRGFNYSMNSFDNITSSVKKLNLTLNTINSLSDASNDINNFKNDISYLGENYGYYTLPSSLLNESNKQIYPYYCDIMGSYSDFPTISNQTRNIFYNNLKNFSLYYYNNEEPSMSVSLDYNNTIIGKIGLEFTVKQQSYQNMIYMLISNINGLIVNTNNFVNNILMTKSSISQLYFDLLSLNVNLFQPMYSFLSIYINNVSFITSISYYSFYIFLLVNFIIIYFYLKYRNIKYRYVPYAMWIILNLIILVVSSVGYLYISFGYLINDLSLISRQFFTRQNLLVYQALLNNKSYFTLIDFCLRNNGQVADSYFKLNYKALYINEIIQDYTNLKLSLNSLNSTSYQLNALIEIMEKSKLNYTYLGDFIKSRLDYSFNILNLLTTNSTFRNNICQVVSTNNIDDQWEYSQLYCSINKSKCVDITNYKTFDFSKYNLLKDCKISNYDFNKSHIQDNITLSQYNDLSQFDNAYTAINTISMKIYDSISKNNDYINSIETYLGKVKNDYSRIALLINENTKQIINQLEAIGVNYIPWNNIQTSVFSFLSCDYLDNDISLILTFNENNLKNSLIDFGVILLLFSSICTLLSILQLIVINRYTIINAQSVYFINKIENREIELKGWEILDNVVE